MDFTGEQLCTIVISCLTLVFQTAPMMLIEVLTILESFICHDGHGSFVLHKRSQNCRDEQGCWDNGGGSHEFGSNIEETIRREVKEEHGADALDMKFISVRDYHRKLADGTPAHWVSILYSVLVNPTQIRNNEPYKIDEVKWFTLDTLPAPLHSTLMSRLEDAHVAGRYHIEKLGLDLELYLQRSTENLG